MASEMVRPGALDRGQRLDRFEIRRRLGSGGSGHVYLAWDPLMGREVALKTCDTDDPPVRERFAREARLAGGLDHPNIVRIFDFRDDETPWFLVQEFLDGEDLSQCVARRSPMPLEGKLRLLEETAAALAFAHEHGVVHRDIKPANIRVLSDGRIKILDFGIARSLDGGPSTTRPGTTIGSLGYMPPEQIEGGPVDPRSDLFAMGVVAYELIAGHRPFDGGSIGELFLRIVHDDPEPLTSFLPSVPDALDALVLQCLAKEPAQRPASAGDVRDRLESIRKTVDLIHS
ncbi:MAG TPA: serine/threonine-protein kinase [Thermoanaerobaculia bacterium]